LEAPIRKCIKEINAERFPIDDIDVGERALAKRRTHKLVDRLIVAEHGEMHKRQPERENTKRKQREPGNALRVQGRRRTGEYCGRSYRIRRPLSAPPSDPEGNHDPAPLCPVLAPTQRNWPFWRDS